MAKTTSGAGDGAPFTMPADLAGMNAEELTALFEQANAEMDSLLSKRDPADLPKLNDLSAARKAIQARQTEVAAEQAEIDAQFDGFASELAPVVEEPAAETETATVEGEVQNADGTPVEQAPQLVTASGRGKGGAVTESRELGGMSRAPKLNLPLSGIRASGPAQQMPSAPQLAMTASVGLPGAFEAGGKIDSVRQLGELFEQRARNMSDQGGRFRARRDGDPYGGVQVASVRNAFDDVLSEDSTQDAIDQYRERVTGMASSDKMETLVAAGGWCAPSQIRYDFFNIASECGMIDLPTFGVERGGIQFPVSPSLRDTFSPALPWYTAFSNATVPWLWTEGDDILAVTGSPTKPCIRVPCSTMSNSRLECYGICLTAGNLADNAWPESTRNFLRLLMSAHYHASNARYISTIANLATAVAACSATGTSSGVVSPVLDVAELGAWDYREAFGMCDTDVIEWVYPNWLKGAVRADLGKRMGIDLAQFEVTDAMLARWFDVRGIRAQFVNDYQVRAAGQPGAATPITAYPSTVRGLMYAPGTVARGNGMTLDLGVVRDSTLNARNDFTAAWMEECHLIARFGHEVREYTMNICPSGMTGANTLTSCCP